MFRAIVALFLVITSGSVWAQVSSSTELSTDFVLMCEEINHVDLQLLRLHTKLPPEATNRLFETMNERNNNPRRPFLALKYVDKKLSFNSQGVEFLIKEIPGEPNMIGWLGEIWIKDDAIYFELINEEINSRMRTTLTIDRFTGLYKELKYSPSKEFPDYESTGKCIKYNERLF
ncbi:MAG: hypothetical protein Q8K59_04990 [Nitrosomonas sp.]|nr:hypothetical protein [Nitrosomonas sp.]MDP1950444.1 hypothetical protein [Nitrosomonas sp.]